MTFSKVEYKKLDSNPLVSIIIIFYNAKKQNFFEEAIESVFSQTCKDWELLLVDDGSTDESTSIALRYAVHHPSKVRYLDHEQHQNLGMSATRNLGIRHARGKYVAFLDADDVWLPQNLETYTAILNNCSEAGAVYGETSYWYSWTGKPEDQEKDYCDTVAQLTERPNTLFQPPHLLILFLRNIGVIPCTCSVMVRRQILIEIGGFEDSFKGMYEDQVFYTKLCLHTPVLFVSECLAKYRRHPDSCCSVAQDLNQESHARYLFLSWIDNYLSKRGIQNLQLDRLLQEQLKPYRHPTFYKISSSISQIYRIKDVFLGWLRKYLTKLSSTV